MNTSDPAPLSAPVSVSGFDSIVGIDVGSQVCIYTVCQPDNRPAVKPTELINGWVGFEQLERTLHRLSATPARVLIGLEVISRCSENLYYVLKQ